VRERLAGLLEFAVVEPGDELDHIARGAALAAIENPFNDIDCESIGATTMWARSDALCTLLLEMDPAA
jgi:hypothetical protein